MIKQIPMGEYAAPEISVIEVTSEGVVCASLEFNVPEDTSYDYYKW